MGAIMDAPTRIPAVPRKAAPVAVASDTPAVPDRKSMGLDQLVEFYEMNALSSGGLPVSRERAFQVSAFFCGVRVLAEGCAQVPVRIRRERIVGNKVYRTVAHDHWAQRLVARQPNGWMTSFEFREFMTIAAVVDRGGLAIKNIVRDEVRELLPVPMGCWSVEQLPNWRLRFRVDYADKSHGYFDQSQVFFLRGPSTDGFSGLPALRIAREALGLAASIEGQQARLSGRGGNPSGVLAFDGALKPETKDRLRETWSERYGPGGTGGVAVLDQAAKFHQLTMSSVDAQLLETRRHQIEEIGRHLRVLPIMLMQSDKANSFASAEQMFRAHVTHSLAPWVRRWEEAVGRDVLAAEPDLICDLVERVLLQGDFSDMGSYLAAALGAGGGKGWLTQNEAREIVGEDPMDDPEADRLAQGAMEQQGTASDGP